ncbi:MAG: hypothetical protein K2X11_19140 [Acetobacteraceae bacterium]|nr:hypothetical protein [Acetobacteraceae bacterium]
MALRLVCLLLMAAWPAAGQTLDPRSVEGVYRYRFPNALVTGETFRSENTMEVVRVAPGAAYLRLELTFFNGHGCSLRAVARVEGNELVHRRGERDGEPACTLRLRFDGGRATLSDADGGCRASACGARGGFEGMGFATASRRAITDMARLRASREFREAMAEFEGRAPPR